LAGVDETLPHLALGLNVDQSLVHIPDVHAGANVFFRQLFQASLLSARHRLGGVTVTRGDNNFCQGAVKHSGNETVETVSKVCQKVDELGHARQGGGLGKRRVRDHCSGSFHETREHVVVEASGCGLGFFSLLLVVKLHAIPGAIRGTVAELAEVSGLPQQCCRFVSAFGQRGNRFGAEFRSRFRCGVLKAQFRQLVNTVDHAHAKARVRLAKSRAVFDDDRA
jgi:hypothetical protein